MFLLRSGRKYSGLLLVSLGGVGDEAVALVKQGIAKSFGFGVFYMEFRDHMKGIARETWPHSS